MTDLAATPSPETKNQENVPMEFDTRLDDAIRKSRDYLLSRQVEDGYWIDELEVNMTITAELIFFMHLTGTVDLEKQEKLAQHLLNKQKVHRPMFPWVY